MADKHIGSLDSRRAPGSERHGRSRRTLIGAALAGAALATLDNAGIGASSVSDAVRGMTSTSDRSARFVSAGTPVADETNLVRSKLEQATRILDELDIDLWMPVARESATLSDPVLPLILGTSVTWESAFLISRAGNHRAIVGSGDVENVRQTGAWDDVVGYVEDFGETLRGALAEYDPRTLALDYSVDNFMADGLTHGMYLRLQDILATTPYWGRVISGEPVSVRLRSRKSPGRTASHSSGRGDDQRDLAGHGDLAASWENRGGRCRLHA